LAVAKSQLAEVFDVLTRWLPSKEARAQLLAELSATNAFKRNKSFRMTIEALTAFNGSFTDAGLVDVIKKEAIVEAVIKGGVMIARYMVEVIGHYSSADRFRCFSVIESADEFAKKEVAPKKGNDSAVVYLIRSSGRFKELHTWEPD
jgi:hypothetical protein